MRVLIFSADIGEGHDLPARVLRDAIVARSPGAAVAILDALEVAGPVARAVVRSNAEVVLERLPWLFDVQYALLTRWAPTRRLGSAIAMLLGGRGILNAISAHRPDVVISTYPGATEVLGKLRRRGCLGVPVVSAITDLAALRFWAHPGCDLHLVIHAESAAEVRAIAGPSARARHVRGLTSPAFDTPVDGREARAALGVPSAVGLVVVSGGGWGVGDLDGAVRTSLGVAANLRVIVVCGRNAALRARVQRAFAHEPRVHVLGFTDQMSDLLAAADVLVHSTAGLTVLEALVRGARVISYGWGVGHIRLNNRAYERFGLADVARDRAALAGSLRRALASPGRPDLAYGALPRAADLVLELAGGDGARRAQGGAAGQHE